MPLWGNKDQANNKPNILTVANTSIFGVDVAESKLKSGVAHPGWVQVRYGTGPVRSIAIANGGSGYTNGAAVTFTGDGTGASANVNTNGAGAITSVTLNAGGSGYTVTPTLSVSGGTGGVLVATMGGRANRVTYETLVAMSSLTLDASDDSVFPDS